MPLAEVALGTEERHRLIREAGWAIRAVHEIGIPGFGVLEEATYLRNAQVQGQYDSWEEYLDGALESAVTALRTSGAIDDAGVDRINRVCCRPCGNLYDLGPVGQLLHGSFDPSHVLVDEGRVTGLVDFGERRSGDPAWDIGGFLMDSIGETRHLLEGYDPDKRRGRNL